MCEIVVQQWLLDCSSCSLVSYCLIWALKICIWFHQFLISQLQHCLYLSTVISDTKHKVSWHMSYWVNQQRHRGKKSLCWTLQSLKPSRPEKNLEKLVKVWAVLYLRACGFLDGGVGALWCPGDALHHVFVLPQFSLAVFRSHNPNTHCLVIWTAGDQCAVLVWPHHTDPLSVACEGLHTVSNKHITITEVHPVVRVDVIHESQHQP